MPGRAARWQNRAREPRLMNSDQEECPRRRSRREAGPPRSRPRNPRTETPLPTRPRTASSVSAWSGRQVAGRRRFAVASQQGPYFGFAEPAVPPRSPDAGDAPGGRPAGDGLGIHPEQCGHLSRREQSLVIAVHVQSPPTVSLELVAVSWTACLEPLVRCPSSLALNEYFLPRFLEIGPAFRARLGDSR